MINPSPQLKARSFRQIGSRFIFAWGSVVSAAVFAVLTVIGSAPVVDDHITWTAVLMLFAYLLMRVAIEAWLTMVIAQRRRQRG